VGHPLDELVLLVELDDISPELVALLDDPVLDVDVISPDDEPLEVLVLPVVVPPPPFPLELPVVVDVVWPELVPVTPPWPLLLVVLLLLLAPP
jgi:hypothetical protein